MGTGDAKVGVAVDTAVLDELRNVGGGDLGFVQELVDIFLEDVPAGLAKARAALGASNHGDLARIAHAMLSTTNNLGAVKMSSLLRQVETDARQNELAGLPAKVEALEAAFTVAREGLLAYIAAHK